MKKAKKLTIKPSTATTAAGSELRLERLRRAVSRGGLVRISDVTPEQMMQLTSTGYPRSFPMAGPGKGHIFQGAPVPDLYGKLRSGKKPRWGGMSIEGAVLDESLVLTTPLPPGGGIVTGDFAEDIANGTLVDKLRSAGVQVEVPTAEEEAAELAAMAGMTQEELNERFGMSPEDVTGFQQDLE